jgi:hypothetical protein
VPSGSGALAVAEGLYKACHDNLFLRDFFYFFFHQALVFQASIVCKLCSATPSDVMKIVIYALCRMHLTLFGGDK